MRLQTIRPRIATIDTRAVKPPPKQADPIYSTPEYQAWRAKVIARASGRCQDPRCKSPHRRGIRLFADHVIEMRDGGAPFDTTNGLARCGSCHTIKTLEARAKRTAARHEPTKVGG